MKSPPDRVHWNALIGETTIKDKYSSHYKKVHDDLKKLKDCGILHRHAVGYFSSVVCDTEEYGVCFMYHHKNHAMCSNVTVSKISFIAKIVESYNYVERHCGAHRSHYNFLPYFVGDHKLETSENKLKEKGDDDRAAEVNEYRKRAML